MSPAPSDCASNLASRYSPLRPRLEPPAQFQTALDPQGAEEAKAAGGGRRRAGRSRAPWDRPAALVCFFSGGETEERKEQCGPKPRSPGPTRLPDLTTSTHPEYLGERRNSLRSLCPSNSEPAEAQLLGEGSMTRGARHTHPDPVSPHKQMLCLPRARRAARPRSDEDSMEPRATARAAKLGRARGSIWSSCRQHARGSIQPAGPRHLASPNRGQEAQDVRPTEGETPTSQRLRFRVGNNILAPNVLRVEPWSTPCAASPGPPPGGEILTLFGSKSK